MKDYFSFKEKNNKFYKYNFNYNLLEYLKTYCWVWTKMKKIAEYWKELLKNISKYLTKNFWKWYSVQNLEFMRKFYLTFPKIDFRNSQSLIRKLSWTNIIRLLFVKKAEERAFYIIEAIENSWSVRELDRQINSALYERLALSRDKEKVKKFCINKFEKLKNYSSRFMTNANVCKLLW